MLEVCLIWHSVSSLIFHRNKCARKGLQYSRVTRNSDLHYNRCCSRPCVCLQHRNAARNPSESKRVLSGTILPGKSPYVLTLLLQATIRPPVVKNMEKALWFQFTAGSLPLYAVTFMGYWAYGSATSSYLLNNVKGPVWIKATANMSAFLQTVIALHVSRLLYVLLVQYSSIWSYTPS
jgi:hypothetical protein